MKKCTKCGKTKREEDFYSLFNQDIGITHKHSYCKVCNKEISAITSRQEMQHLAKIRQRIKKKKCIECGETYTSVPYCKKHLEIQTKYEFNPLYLLV